MIPFLNFIAESVIHGCKCVLGTPKPIWKAAAYILMSGILSLLGETFPLVASCCPGKDHWSNQWIAKNSVGIWCSCLATFSGGVAYVLGFGRPSQAATSSMLRLAMIIGAWLATTYTYDMIEGKHSSIQLSGHSYILVFLGLVAMEEVSPFHGIQRLDHTVQLESAIRHGDAAGNTRLSTLSPADFRALVRACLHTMPVIKVSYVFAGALTLFLDAMVLCTFLTYHVPFEKVFGTVNAVFEWLLMYKVVLPAMGRSPGHGGHVNL